MTSSLVRRRILLIIPIVPFIAFLSFFPALACVPCAHMYLSSLRCGIRAPQPFMSDDDWLQVPFPLQGDHCSGKPRSELSPILLLV